MRLRDLGMTIGSLPTGRRNAITDVRGVLVGHETIISQDTGRHAARTGVTAIFPHADIVAEPVYSGVANFNGNGEMTGTQWIDESGLLTTPICLTNTHSVGVVRDAVISYFNSRQSADEHYWMLPVVAETWDGWLSDINGMHVTVEHAHKALDAALANTDGVVAEGSVGGGTGMIAHDFKGGIGTSSRVVKTLAGEFTVGALVQANYGSRAELRIEGVPVGHHIPLTEVPGRFGASACPDVPRASEEHDRPACSAGPDKGDGSIIIILATDAPLLPDQCQRLARRGAIGLARMGSVAADSSGDLFLAFSTANKLKKASESASSLFTVSTVRHDVMTPLFYAAAEAVNEAIVNAMCMGETMRGCNGRIIHALPHGKLRILAEQFGAV